jgi:hypothetical protein
MSRLFIGYYFRLALVPEYGRDQFTHDRGLCLDHDDPAEAMEETGNGTSDKDTLFMLSGMALVVFGAGLISNPIARRYLGRFGLGNLAQAALPDLDRCLKPPSM